MGDNALYFYFGRPLKLKSKTLLVSCFLNIVQAFAIVVLVSRVPYLNVQLSIPVSQFIHSPSSSSSSSSSSYSSYPPITTTFEDHDPYEIPEHLSVRYSAPSTQTIEILPNSNDDNPALDVSYPSYAAAVLASRTFKFPLQRLVANRSLLFFNTFTDFVERLDRSYYETIEAALEHPQLNVYLWGPGYPGYDGSKSATENLSETFGCSFFDIVYVRVRHFDIQGCGKTIIAQELGDCHYGQCLQTYHPGANLTLVRYAYTPIELFNMNIERRESDPHMFAHNPDCANRAHPAVPYDQKRYNSTLFGSTDKGLFPLRHKIKRGIKFGTITSAEHMGHPGYRIPLPPQAMTSAPFRPDHRVPLSSDTFSQLQGFISHVRSHNREYHFKMAHSKICVFDSSVERKAMRKFFEAFLSGCVVASDLPYELEEELRDVVIQLHVNDTDDVIERKLFEALLDPVELRRKASKAMAIAHRQFTCHSKIERLLRYADEYNSGFRGYYFPFGFRMGCHSYLKPLTRPNKWCPA
eukprot:CAMPEP_0184671896 /NCGR_PEP_ID=MMETSP0308-20130426/85777_1 /TAXON_ID=38269 /ORGANISM="Gloeochaete witrockiana, Strain SAG 46.84" /LENGTH=522 /DNA_ID=CAMNT_0027119117 /DNA_START=107 /DNA_END=1675 /DNA_ORIENTATION=+